LQDSFLTIKKKSVSEIKINKSKFISQAIPLNNKSEVPDIIKEVKKKFFDASHHPYAYRIGFDENNFKASDDGEPSGSSGKPILESIDKHHLKNIIVIVTKYFGGIKLGVGGLRRAYFEAAETSVMNAEITEVLITKNVFLEFDYKFMNSVLKYIETEKFNFAKNNSDEKCKISIDVRLSAIEKMKSVLIELTKGKIVIEVE